MTLLARNSGVSVSTTLADIKVSMRITFSLRIPSPNTTDSCIAVVMTRSVRNPNITKPTPTPIRWLRRETDPGVLETTNIYTMDPNIRQLNGFKQGIDKQNAGASILWRASTDKIESYEMDTSHIPH
jgi:hypothetical protein